MIIKGLVQGKVAEMRISSSNMTGFTKTPGIFPLGHCVGVRYEGPSWWKQPRSDLHPTWSMLDVFKNDGNYLTTPPLISPFHRKLDDQHGFNSPSWWRPACTSARLKPRQYPSQTWRGREKIASKRDFFGVPGLCFSMSKDSKYWPRLSNASS